VGQRIKAMGIEISRRIGVRRQWAEGDEEREGSNTTEYEDYGNQ